LFQKTPPLRPLRSIWDGLLLGYCDAKGDFYPHHANSADWQDYKPCESTFDDEWKRLAGLEDE
jgi:hypothetical protein